MLKDKVSSAIVAVKDLARARTFYSETLGLEAVEGGEEMGVVVYKTGATHLVVYQSAEAGTNRANAVVWDAAGDIHAIVGTLRDKGVTFERYPEMDEMEFRDGIYSAGEMKMAWFKDPDGNVLHINQMP